MNDTPLLILSIMFWWVVILYQTQCSVMTFTDKCFKLLVASQEGRHFGDWVLHSNYNFIQWHAQSIFHNRLQMIACLFHWAWIILGGGGKVNWMRTPEFSVACYFFPPIEYSPIYANLSVAYNFTDWVECSFPMRTAVRITSLFNGCIFPRYWLFLPPVFTLIHFPGYFEIDHKVCLILQTSQTHSGEAQDCENCISTN